MLRIIGGREINTSLPLFLFDIFAKYSKCFSESIDKHIFYDV